MFLKPKNNFTKYIVNHFKNTFKRIFMQISAMSKKRKKVGRYILN